MTDYQGKQSFHYQWKVLGILSVQSIIIMKERNLKYYAQRGKLPLWGVISGVFKGPKQTLKHLGSNQELF